jgi:hypothetical protein
MVGKINVKRLEWFGHIQRMDKHRITTKITNCTPALLNRPKGRPKKRWLDSMREDLKITGVLDWKKSALDRKKS